MFENRHAVELKDYFSNAVDAACGLRSSFGWQLHALVFEASLVRPPEWDGYSEPPPQTIYCNPTRQIPGDFMAEISDAGVEAVREHKRVREAVRMTGLANERILRAYYTPRPMTAPFGLQSLGDLRAVVTIVLDEGKAQELAKQAAARPADAADGQERAAVKEARETAKGRLAAAERQARMLVEGAENLYAEMIAIVRRRERAAHVAKFENMGGRR